MFFVCFVLFFPKRCWYHIFKYILDKHFKTEYTLEMGRNLGLKWNTAVSTTYDITTANWNTNGFIKETICFATVSTQLHKECNVSCILQKVAKFKTLSFCKKKKIRIKFLHVHGMLMICTEKRFNGSSLIDKLITQNMHYQPLFIGCSLLEIAKFKPCRFVQKYFFTIKLLHAHVQ